MFGRMGIALKNGLVAIANLTAGEFTVGSSEKPTGITMYDEATGMPYCLKIKNGAAHSSPGKCVAKDLSAGAGGATGGTTGGTGSGDTQAPVISMAGAPTVPLFINDPYTDAGATANDAVDGSVPVITLINGTPADTVTIDTSAPGTYTITYRAIDSAGNVATRSRLVTVTFPAEDSGAEEGGEAKDPAPTQTPTPASEPAPTPAPAPQSEEAPAPVVVTAPAPEATPAQ
jgi:hypothetical protein